MDVDDVINELLPPILNVLISRDDLGRIELFTTLEVIKNCTRCKGKKIYECEFYESIRRKKFHLARERRGKLEEQNNIIDELNEQLFGIDNELNKKMLCKGCKEKEIRKLTNKYGNKEIARFLYEHKSNATDCDEYIQWIPIDEFRNIEYLIKGSFGEFHKATWINGYYNHYNPYRNFDTRNVVLKRTCNSSDKIADILKEVCY